jgi:hypothetical protein
VDEPFDPGTVRGNVLRILDGPGLTVFTKRAKEMFLNNDMTSADAVNVLRGGRIAKAVKAASGRTHRAETQRMIVEFSFRGDGRAAPNELVIESAWRTHR